MGPGCITDPGEGRWVPLVPHKSLGKDADKAHSAYSFQFEKSEKYLTFEGMPSMNNKLLDGDKPRYFKIEEHPYHPDMHAIKIAENKSFHVGLAMEHILPPWIAMSSLPDMQQWKIKKI
ncbi:hypothetical protein V565_168650 [Rhizoctonia solani 123E]|uniref:Uncharacterized protein n=1 Tax=Rhizoctonia solani 123E TaxID=1423351 RepID=A0A074RP11_9AGAM|nr:hypothetical protein V565_168650 [Rhizoctonia solani 123E]